MKLPEFVGGLFLLIAFAVAEDKSKEVGTVVGIDLGTTYSW